MTRDTKKRLLRYGIALDLVILVTGLGLLLPDIPPIAVAGMFLLGVVLSTVKGGWQGGIAATALALVALFTAFAATVPQAYDVAFAIVSLVVCAAAFVAKRPLAMHTATTAAAPPLAPVVAFRPDEAEEEEQREHERQLDEERRAAELARRRLEAEREELARKLEEERRAAQEKQEKLEQEARERAELEKQLEAERAAAAKKAAEEEERLAAERAAQEKLEAERAAAERAAQEKILAERAATARGARKKIKAERLAAERAAREKVEAERAALERAAQEKIEAERLAADRAAQEKIEAERAALAKQLEEERAAAELAAQEKLEAERAALARQFEEERAAAERAAQEKLEAERAALAKKLEEERAALKAAAAVAAAPAPQPRNPATPQPQKPGLLSRLFNRTPAPAPSVNLKTKKVNGNATAPRQRVTSTKTSAVRRPRILLLEKRRGTADTVVPKLKQRGVDIEVVERWIDAVDEIFRFRPDAFFIDAELPDFEKVYKAMTEHSPNLPIVLTMRQHGTAPAVQHAATATRPYDADALIALAKEAMSDPNNLLARQAMPVDRKPTPPRPSVGQALMPVPPVPRPKPQPQPDEAQARGPVPHTDDDTYEPVCFNCRVPFDPMDADWCSCLTKERTLVCTNCLTCFCKAPPAYKEKFWVDAPPKLFERKTSELRRQPHNLENPPVAEVRRPLVMLVEDDEDIQGIVHRVCQNLGYGFVGALNGQDGLELAAGYRPNLILSDAFMPKLDGREMCRQLKEDPAYADTKMVVMTGLYTDTKYKSEAVKRFHVDDYLSKPVSITDLINLLQKHLEGVVGLPVQEDLYELHRKDLEKEAAGADSLPEDGVALAELLEPGEEADEPQISAPPARPRPRSDEYVVACFTCHATFDATKAEWCTCLGRDNTLVCPHCSNCFCKAPSEYRERFWIDAPPTLFERKMIGSKRALAGKLNPTPMDVKRPLILLVEDDENIQLIVKTVVTTMGYGFIVGANGQEGLSLAREYTPDLILSDAFMPKLDGREMCRLLKEDPTTARAKAIIMTGLYTDRKYRNEALSYFKVDDYVAKPLAVDDLIKLMKKHLPQEAQATM